MKDEIQPTDWFAGMDFGTDVYAGRDGATVRNSRQRGASPEADLLDRQTVPQDDASYRARLAEVFSSREAALAARVAADPELQRLARRARLDRDTAERLFTRLSATIGEVFGFAPAPLAWGSGLPADNAIGLFLRGAGWERVVLSSRLLESPAAFVDTAVHEQTHRLQHALTCRLNAPQIPMDPLERGLVLYWLRKEPDRKRDYALSARIRDPRARLAAYRAIPIEFHAYGAAERLLEAGFPGLRAPGGRGSS